MYLKWGIGWLVLIFCVSGLWGGEVCAKNIEEEKDSLLNIIRNSPHDTSTLRAYYNIANLYLFNNPDSLKHYGEKLLTLAKKQQKPLYQGLAHQVIGSAFFNQNELTPALQHFMESVSLLESISPLPKELIAVYGQIITTYAELTDYKSGMEFARKCITLSEQRKNPEGMAVAYNNIGDLLDKQGEYDKAMTYYQKSMEIATQNQFKLTMAITNYNMGYISRLKGEADNALRYIYQSRKISGELNDIEGLIYCYHEFGRLYYMKKDIKRAIIYTDSARILNKKYSNKKLLKDVYLLFSDIYESERKYDSAYYYHKQYTAIKDSIYNEFRQKLVYSLTTNQKIQSLQQKSLENEIKLNHQNKKNDILIIIGIILSGGLLFFVLLNEQKKKSNQILSVQKQQIEQQKEELSSMNETKDKLFSVISHDLRSPINQLKSLLALLSNNVISKEDFMNITQKFHTQIDTLSDSLENILIWANSMFYQNHLAEEEVNISEELAQVIMLYDYVLSDKELKINMDVPENAVVKTHREPFVIAVRNLISNAIKFSHKGEEIKVFVEETEESVSLVISDKGIGMTPEQIQSLFNQDQKNTTLGTMKEKGSGIGLRITHEFVTKCGGSLRAESKPGEGSTFYLTYPK
ncbi:MAG: tetratricopeptide repeat-containing sensor histidine kinase [Bacteroidia bacterium]|nr:tetratricopeptide repeat-containing sensor histidine kinase [Bacteroidia bacterium]